MKRFQKQNVQKGMILALILIGLIGVGQTMMSPGTFFAATPNTIQLSVAQPSSPAPVSKPAPSTNFRSENPNIQLSVPSLEPAVDISIADTPETDTIPVSPNNLTTAPIQLNTESPMPVSPTELETIDLYPANNNTMNQTESSVYTQKTLTESPINRPEELEFPQMSEFPESLPIVEETVSRPEIQPDTMFVASRTADNRSIPNLYSFPVSSRPGDTVLEGEQKGMISLVKKLPEEVQVGEEMSIKIELKNNGSQMARNLVLCDQIPEGTRLVSTEPGIEPGEDGSLLWSGFDLQPNEQRTFIYRLIPETEGEFGSVASVSFQINASGKTRCTRPLLQLAVNAPNQTLIGEKFRLDIQISNPGTGIARNVVLREEVPDGLQHPGGKLLENSIGDLAPGEAKNITLTLQSMAAGTAINRLSVSADGNLTEKVESNIAIQAPEIALEISGAKLRYLEREAVYTLKIWNPGSAPAQNLKLFAEIPPQMKFVRTNNEGAYDESTHSVHWELPELPNNMAPGEIELTLLPVEAGSGALKFYAQGEMNIAADTSHDITVDGLPALSFSVVSLSDPVEVGQDALYEIHLTNRGTKASNNVKIAVALPEGMEAVNVNGPTRSSTEAAGVAFAPLVSLGAKEEQVYTMTIRCHTPGDHRIRVRVASDDMEPLIKEESVRIYSSN